MNYFGKLDAKVSDALGQHPGAHLYSESVHATHVPSDAIVVPDAQLLFGAEFKRTGVDLVLSGEGRELVLHDYFRGEHRAALSSPDGAHLTGDLVTALAGEVQVAQADGNADPHKIIGHVTKLVGTATAIRNGVSIILNNGDNVEKGDVVASGSDSTLGITFIDGTVFGLSSNARMVLNEMVYDPNGSNNSSLLSLVAGTITFVAGETAKHGDMKVDTPVATMGIRGTAVLVEIDFSVPGTTPDAKFQVLVEPDGTTGSYILFDKTTLTPLAVVNQAGTQINISNGIMSQTLAPLSPEVQKLINDVFTLKFSDSSNTKSLDHFTDTIVPTDGLGLLKFAGLTLNGPVAVTITTFDSSSPSSTPGIPPIIVPHIPNALHIATTNGIIVERAGAGGTGQDTVSGTIKFVDINPTDRPTVSTEFRSVSLQNAQGQDITSTLTATQLAQVEAALTLAANPGNNNNGGYNWSYSVPASALSSLPPGSTLTLTYNATVNNNYGPQDETVTAPITVTIKVSGEIWNETNEISSTAPGDWNHGANWLTGLAPTATDDVIIVTDPAQTGTPFYPVTIKSEDGGGPAFANSVTMGDLGGQPPELDNFNSLTIGSGGLHLNADSILNNFGTLTIGGLVEVLQHSVLQNSGLLTLQQGGDFKAQSQITNSGAIELTGGTLNVEVDVVNSDGALQVDNGAMLKLTEGATIVQGVVALAAGSVLDVESTAGAALDGVMVNGISGDGGLSAIDIGAITPGGSVLTLEDGTFISNGDMTIAAGSSLHIESGGGATLDGVTVIGTSGDSPSNIEIGFSSEGGSILTLLEGTSIANGAMAIAANSTLDVESAGGAILDGVTVTGTNGYWADGATAPIGPLLMSSMIEIGLDGEGGSILTLLDGTSITYGNITIAADSILDVESAEGAILDNAIVTGTNGDSPSTIEIGFSTDGGSILTLLDGTSIAYGSMTIAAHSMLDIESSGGAILDGVDVANSGTIQVDGVGFGTTVTLVLDGGTAITGGDLLIHSPGSAEQGIVEIGKGGATFDGVTVTNKDELIIDSLATLTLTGKTSITGGTIDDNGTIAGHGAISSAIAGPGAVTANGGTLTLSGENTYSGLTTIDNGSTLALSGSGSIADSNDVVDDGTFDIAGLAAGTSITTLSGTGMVTLGGNTLTLTEGVGTFSGVISGSGGLTVEGAGTETLSGDNTYTGVTTIGFGETLALSGSISLSSNVIDDGIFDISGTSSGASVVTLSGTGKVALGSKTLTLSNASTTFSGTIGGTGGLTLLAGMLILTGDSTYSGTTTISGTLTLSGLGSIADSGDVIDHGTFDISGLTTGGTSIVTLSGDGTVKLGSNALTLTNASSTFSGTIGGAGGLTLTAGTEILTGTNTYSGVTTISGGTLALSGPGSIVDSSDVIDKGTFDISATTSGASIVTLSGNGIVNLGSRTLTLSDGSSTFSGTIGGIGGLTLTAGTETLTGTNTYTGATTINGGTLALSGSGSIAHSSGVIDDGTFDISGTNSGASIVTLSGDGALKLGNETLTLTHALTAFDGTISSTGGGITVSAGTLTLGTMILDDLTLAGSFDNSGTLTVNHTVTLSGASIDGGTLDISGILESTGTSTISDATIINPGHIDVESGTLTIDPTPFANTGTFEVESSAVLSGEIVTGTVLQEVVTNTNGVIQIDHGGTLTLFDTTVIGGTIIDNGTLLLTGTTSKLENVAFSGSATLDISSHSTLEIDGTVTSGVTVKFDQADGHSELILDDPSSFQGMIAGLVETSCEKDENYVDLKGFTYNDDTRVKSVSYNSDTGVTAVKITNGIDSLTIDLHGDYSKGDFEFASDHSGGTLFADPAANSGAVTIDSGTTLDIGGASSAIITFTNSAGTTGELVLNDSHDFTGTIAGFAGDGTIANSNLLDLMDVKFADIAASKTTYTENAAGTGGTLTLYDTNGHALDSLNFTGNYQLANFTIENDGNGGTLIVDPPVNSPAPANSFVASAANQTLSGSAPSDNFVFNFPGVGQSTITNFHATTDTLQFGSSIFADAQTALNAVHDDGHGNAVLAIDAHDSITLTGVLKSQLHVSDFHIV